MSHHRCRLTSSLISRGWHEAPARTETEAFPWSWLLPTSFQLGWYEPTRLVPTRAFPCVALPVVVGSRGVEQVDRH